MLDVDDLGPADEELVKLLREGRVTAPYAADETGYSLQYVRDRLGRLVEHGNVRKVYEGLYELVDDPASASRARDEREPSDGTGELGDESTEEDDHADGAEELRETEPAETDEGGGELPDEGLDAVEFPGSVDAEAARTAVLHARDYIRDHGGATKKEIVRDLMPEHPLGYDVDGALAKIEAGERYRGAWWRKVVKPGLEALDEVAKPTGGRSEWRYTGE
jgi:hypothetical protein